MGARENVCQIWQNYILHMRFSEFYLCNNNSWEIWLSFSGTSMRNFLWCYYRRFIMSLAFKKCKKGKDIFKIIIILVQGFCPLKLKLLNFLMDSVLKSFKIPWNQVKSGRFSVVIVAILERINVSGPYFLSAWPNPGKHHWVNSTP